MRSTVRFDWAIKRLLRNKANFDILEGFLSELLSFDVKIKSILESESNQEHANNKVNRVDLLVEDERGRLIIIEVQSNYMHDYLLRMLFGTSKLIVDNMDRGMSYTEVRKVISVNVVYFNLGHGHDYVYRGATNFVGIHRRDVLNLSAQEQSVFHEDLIEKLYPEYYVIKVNQFDDISRNTLDEWINFLKNEKVNDSTSAKGLIAAREKLDILKLSPDERMEYDRDMEDERDYESVIVSNYKAGEFKGKSEGLQQGMQQGMQQGIQQGMQEGMQQGMQQGIEMGMQRGREQGVEEGVEQGKMQERIEVARNMLKMGMNVAAISQATGLVVEQITGL